MGDNNAFLNYMIRVLNAPKDLKDAQLYAVQKLQEATKFATKHNKLDFELSGRVTKANNELEETIYFHNQTKNLRKELITALKDAVLMEKL